MWRKNRNVEVTYNPLPSSASSPQRLEDEVAYYTIGSTKRSTVVGIDTACGEGEGGELGAFDWRGKGWLKLVSSHWEVLGWGYVGEGGEHGSSEERREAPAGEEEEEGKEEDKWMMTWFSKTVFTPAGIDVYARTKGGHAGWVVEKLREALAGMEDEEMRKLGTELFEVVRE